jgi:hypothetical protein
MKRFVFAICAVVALAGAFSARARNSEFQYVFESSSSAGFPLSDWGGSLFLDSSSSPSDGGSLSDINMTESFLRTPYGTFYLDESMNVAIGDISRVPVPFSWSPTTITSMDITGFVQLNEGGNIGVIDYSWQITASYIEIQQPDPLANGQWVASVPDSASTAILISLAAAGLRVFANFSRFRQLAMARPRRMPARTRHWANLQ